MIRPTDTFRLAIRKGLDYSHELVEASHELRERSLELRDLLKVPSLVSLSGLALVLHGGRRIETLAGVNEIAAGRSFDLLDGFLARALSQESDMGATVDAVSDKIGMTYLVGRAWQTGVVPRPALGVVMGSNVCNAVLTGIATIKHPEANFQTPREGKIAMAAFNAGFFSYAYASALEREYPEKHFHQPLRALGGAAIAAGAAYAVPAATTYLRRARLPLVNTQ